MTAQREPRGRKTWAGTIEMSDVRPTLAIPRGDRLHCQMLEVEAEPGRVPRQRGDGARTDESSAGRLPMSGDITVSG